MQRTLWGALGGSLGSREVRFRVLNNGFCNHWRLVRDDDGNFLELETVLYGVLRRIYVDQSRHRMLFFTGDDSLRLEAPCVTENVTFVVRKRTDFTGFYGRWNINTMYHVE